MPHKKLSMKSWWFFVLLIMKVYPIKISIFLLFFWKFIQYFHNFFFYYLKKNLCYLSVTYVHIWPFMEIIGLFYVYQSTPSTILPFSILLLPTKNNTTTFYCIFHCTKNTNTKNMYFLLILKITIFKMMEIKRFSIILFLKWWNYSLFPSFFTVFFTHKVVFCLNISEIQVWEREKRMLLCVTEHNKRKREQEGNNTLRD